MTLAERYRAQAAWAREKAEPAEVPELRERWLSLARQYDELAAELETKREAR